MEDEIEVDEGNVSNTEFMNEMKLNKDVLYIFQWIFSSPSLLYCSSSFIRLQWIRCVVGTCSFLMFSLSWHIIEL